MADLKNKHRQTTYIVLICLFFIIVYAFSLRFVYVEGDDASILTYHLLGRDNNIRPRYRIYQAMFDIILSLLPPSEKLLRFFCISLSALSACIFSILAIKICFHWTSTKKNEKTFYTILFLLLSPELFFSGLYINPSIVAGVFVLLAHNLLLITREDEGIRIYRLFASAILFGFGVSIRWTTSIYGIAIFLDLFIRKNSPIENYRFKDKKLNLFRSFLWLLFAFLFTALFIMLSLSNEINLFQPSSILTIAVNYLSVENQRYFSLITIARMLSLFSPVLILISAIGLFSLWSIKSRKLLIISISQFLITFFFIKSGRVKDAMTFFPIIGMVFISGINHLKKLVPTQKLVYLSGLITLLSILPWFIGIKIYSNSTLWGPGFEVRKPITLVDSSNIRRIDYAPGINFTYKNISPVLDAGFALASPEGPRPLGGYAFVLLGGQWREFVGKVDQAQQDIVERGIESGVVIQFGAGMDSRLINKLINEGYNKDYSLQLSTDGDYSLPSRSITDQDGNLIKIYYVSDPKTLLESEFCKHNPKLCDRPVPLIANYTSDINKLFHQVPVENIEILNPFTAELNFES